MPKNSEKPIFRGGPMSLRRKSSPGQGSPISVSVARVVAKMAGPDSMSVPSKSKNTVEYFNIKPLWVLS